MSVEPGGNRPIMGLEGHIGIEVFGKDSKLPEGFKALSPKQRKFLVNYFEKKSATTEKNEEAQFKEISAKVEKGNRLSKSPLGKGYLKVYNYVVKRLWNVPGRKTLQEKISSYDEGIAHQRAVEAERSTVKEVVQKLEKSSEKAEPELGDVIYNEIKADRSTLSKGINEIVKFREQEIEEKPDKGLEQVLKDFLGKANEIKGNHQGEEEVLMTVYEPLLHGRNLFSGGNTDLLRIYDDTLNQLADQDVVNWLNKNK